MFKTILSAASGYFKQYKLYAYVAIVVLAFIAGCAATYKVTRGTVDKLEARITVLEADKHLCLAANAVNDKTIESMKRERAAASKTCETQLSIERREAERLRKIQETQGGNDAKPGSQSAGNEVVGGAVGGSGDALLDLLNGLLPGPEGGQGNSVCNSGDSGVSSGAPMVPGTIRYYFCTDQDVRNFAMNWEMQWARLDQCLTILNGLRSAATATATTAAE